MEGTEPLLGPVTAAAEAAGVKPGMRLGEALAMCPSLTLVEPDPQPPSRSGSRSSAGSRTPVSRSSLRGSGCAYFETRGVERLYGGLEQALTRALEAVGSSWDPRVGAAERRFAALAAATVARPGQLLVVSDEQSTAFLAPYPLTLLPLETGRRQELQDLGVRTIGGLAALPDASVAERLGADGRRAHGLARGGSKRRVRGRRQPAEIVETLAFPEAVGNELTLRRAFGALLDQVLARPERGGRFIRKIALSARLVGGGSWRRTTTLRDPTAEHDRLKAALAPKLAELPAPVLELRLELVDLTESRGMQLELVRAEGAVVRSHLREGLKQVRASTGSGSVCSVVEVSPWSRIPESRALLVPRDE